MEQISNFDIGFGVRMAQPFVKLMQSIYIYLIDNDEI